MNTQLNTAAPTKLKIGTRILSRIHGYGTIKKTSDFSGEFAYMVSFDDIEGLLVRASLSSFEVIGVEYSKLTTISKLKKGDYFRKVGKPTVFVYEGRYKGKYTFSRFDDCSSFSEIAKNIEVETEFTF